MHYRKEVVDMTTPMGRPRHLDPDAHRIICAIINAGGSLAAAAQFVGCSPKTIRRELHRNPQFAEQFRNARFGVEIELLKNVRQASQRSWRAAAWLLEHSEPHRYDARREPRQRVQKEFARLLDNVAAIVKEEVKDEAAFDRVVGRLEKLWRTS